jgi:hypothetical protein
MPQASSWLDIYKFEEVLETAVAAELTDRGMPSVVRVWDESETVHPRTVVDLQVATPEDSYSPRASDGQMFLRSWNCRLHITIYTVRSIAAERTAHAGYLSKVRWAMQDWAAINARMTYHEIVTILEAGTSRLQMPDNDMDVSDVQFAVRLAVKPDSWPEDPD